MNLPQFSIKRPVTTVMIFCGLIILSVISLQRLPRELFPPITYPQITISTVYSNAAPEEIETLITKPLEEVVGTVNGLRRINSVSKEGLSLITLEFSWGTDMDFASLNVREKIDLIKELLPRESEEPLIVKFNPFELPVMILSVSKPGVSKPVAEDRELQQAELLRAAKKGVKDELDKVRGVAYCRLTGGLEREILVELDQGRLFASAISILDVVEAVRQANLNYPAGDIKGDFYEYLIRTMGEFKSVSELNDVPVSLDEFIDYSNLMQLQEQKEKKHLIFLSDVGRVKDTYKDVASYSRYNGKDNVAVSVFKQSGANTVEVSKEVRRALERLKEKLPKDVSVKVTYDQASFINSAIYGVRDAAILGGILAFVVLLFFLGSYRPSVIIVVSIPISILVVFSLMYMRKISLNMISLGGLALGVGMLVDAAIVVIENIYRHAQEGKDINAAAIEGSNEVTGAITSAVLTTIAVFIPMIFIVGIAGQLFKELAFTVTYSLLASLAVALTLVPLMYVKYGVSAEMGKGFGFFSSLVNKSEEAYVKYLKIFLKRRKKYLTAIFFIFLLSLLLLFVLDKELMPKIDEGQFTIKIDMPTGALLEVTDEAARKIEGLLLGDKNVEDVMVNVGSAKTERIGESLGSHQAEILVDLVEKRRISTEKFIELLRKKMETLNLKAENIEYMVRGSILQVSSIQRAPINVEIKGANLKTLEELALEVRKKMNEMRGIFGIKSSVEATSPETTVSVIKDKALLYNLSVADIARVAQVALKGYVPTTFKEEGEEIGIRVRLSVEDRKDFSKLSRLIIHSPIHIDIPLMEVATLSQGRGPAAIRRTERERTVFVSANFTGKKFSRLIGELEKKLKGIKTPAGYSVMIGGEKEEMKESFVSLRFVLLLSIIIIYMIMAAQFESLLQPFLIMFTVPLSIIGITSVLFLTATPISVTVIFGVIILGGVVVDNGIVLISYLNILIRERRQALYDAVIEGSKIRLRPILMTSLTTILGLVPLALGIGDESGVQAPMAITIIGGMTVSTFLTLFVLPAIYLISYEGKGE